MNNNKVFLGVLAGAAAGAVLGILFAPHKGKSTRRRMSEQGDKLMADLETKLNGFVEKAEQ
ncbi:MAG: YtxH domain-containing protein [Saprospiraceae bacterium]|jgi:gas vesicle protein|nr:YtxH domain-containing protein [Saprospiraceae bacterium]